MCVFVSDKCVRIPCHNTDAGVDIFFTATTTGNTSRVVPNEACSPLSSIQVSKTGSSKMRVISCQARHGTQNEESLSVVDIFW